MTATMTTDVLIIGTGPAGSAAAALLSSYGIPNIAINRYRWLANTPRAHITNQRTMEVLRDLGRDIEEEAYLFASHQDLMGENVFCESLAGEEIGRMKAWGTHPLSQAEHRLSSPTHMNDLPQTFMEPLLFKTACARGTQARMSTEYLRHEQDAQGVTTYCRDRLSGEEITIRSKYLIGADGGKSLVAEHAGLPFEGRMGVGGSMNIYFRADLTKYVAHRPSVLYWVMQPGADIGGIGMGLVRMVRPWNEWLIVWGYDIAEPAPEVTPELATEVARKLVGDPDLEIELLSANTWTVNNYHATKTSNGRVFCMGDAIHRHPPSNGLGSNTSIQDAFNLCWKLAMVLRGRAGAGLLDSYDAERAPVAKQIVSRANRSITETGPIFAALGMANGADGAQIQSTLSARTGSTPEAEVQRDAIRRAIAQKKYEFDAHGVEMNQRYRSGAILAEDQPEPAYDRDAELHYHPTTWPGARLPHAWLYHGTTGAEVSTLDLCGKGRFTLLTGPAGMVWAEAARKVAQALGLPLEVQMIGPRQRYVDHTGDWARLSEIGDSGCVLVRPDHHVAWRRTEAGDDPQGDLAGALSRILDLTGPDMGSASSREHHEPA